MYHAIGFETKFGARPDGGKVAVRRGAKMGARSRRRELKLLWLKLGLQRRLLLAKAVLGGQCPAESGVVVRARYAGGNKMCASVTGCGG